MARAGARILSRVPLAYLVRRLHTTKTHLPPPPPAPTAKCCGGLARPNPFCSRGIATAPCQWRTRRRSRRRTRCRPGRCLCRSARRCRCRCHGPIAHLALACSPQDEAAVSAACAPDSPTLVTTPTLFVMRDRHANYAAEVELLSAAFSFLAALNPAEVAARGIQVGAGSAGALGFAIVHIERVRVDTGDAGEGCTTVRRLLAVRDGWLASGGCFARRLAQASVTWRR
jgi:hypothetical protein